MLGGMARFRRFGMSDEEWQASQVLVDGVPSALYEPLLQWLLSYLIGGSTLKRGLGFQIFAATEIDLGERANDYVFTEDVVRALRTLQPLQLLQLTDYLMATHQADIVGVVFLTDRMSAAGSKWSPTHDGEAWRLQELVPEGVQTAVEATIATAGSAGSLLQRAWSLAYGIDPNGPESYRMSVKAVETAGANCVISKKRDPSLGDVIGEIKSNPKWTLPFANKAGFETNNQETLVHLMQTLWQGQHDRHMDTLCSVEEARAAVMSASTLVAWFTSGAVFKKA
jgi:hypothetical protein